VSGPGEVSTGSTDEHVPPVEGAETTPLLRVVTGEPTPEELAALVAVLASLGGPAAAPTRRTPEWNANRRLQRVVLRPGPGAWRASGLPG
jgi:Acyl-CoA carboxylase epsilon subunit